MASPRNPGRPISPHLMHVRWPVTMMVSIVHRATGDGMATVGTVLFVAWLATLAAGRDAYAAFLHPFTQLAGGALGYLFGIGLTFAFFQHMASGIRHLVMDTGAAYDLKSTRAAARATFVVSIVLTVLYWAYLLAGK